MNESSDFRSRGCCGPSYLLPWYVAGTLEPDEHRRVEDHLRGCPACRDEVELLGSMKETLARHGLEEAPEAAGFAGTIRKRDPWKVAFAGTMAATLLLGVALVAPLIFPERGGPGVREIRPVTFLPTHRGETSERLLVGEGPWALIVVLPSTAPPGPYALRIERGDLTLVDESVTSDRDGRVALLVRGLAGPDDYRLVLVARDTVDPAEWVYPFTVADPDGGLGRPGG